MDAIISIFDALAYAGGLFAAAAFGYAGYEVVRDRYRARKGLGLRSISG